MTVYVHRFQSSVGYGAHNHREDDADPEAGDERTWAFDCTPACEERITRDIPHTARTAVGVRLTSEEEAESKLHEQAARDDVNRMAMALSQMARADTAARAAAPKTPAKARRAPAKSRRPAAQAAEAEPIAIG